MSVNPTICLTAYSPLFHLLEIKQFMQKVLESKNKRNYAIVVFLAYTGARISEALSIWLDDFDLRAGECIIRNGEGDKQRLVLMNTKPSTPCVTT